MRIIGRDQWTKPTNPESPYKAKVYCPDCHLTIGILFHEIASDGTVSPGLICPHTPCIFQDYVKLDGWGT